MPEFRERFEYKIVVKPKLFQLCGSGDPAEDIFHGWPTLDQPRTLEHRFWEPKLVKGTTFRIRFGEIGEQVHVHLTKFSTEVAAFMREMEAVRDKLSEGFIPTTETINGLLENVPPKESPEALGSICIGKHIDDKAAEKFSRWLTGCIRYGLEPDELKRLWLEKWLSKDTRDIVLALEGGNIEDDKTESEHGLEGLDEEIEEMNGDFRLALGSEDMEFDSLLGPSDFYSTAFERGADRFICVHADAYTWVVALRGDPGALDIIKAVWFDQNIRIVNKDKLPSEIGRFSPIASIDVSGEEVRLRDGRKIKVNLDKFTDFD